jgi:hypothetical protein
MFNYQHLYEYGPAWAQQLRSLAVESHQLMRAAYADPIALESMLARIDDVRRELRELPHAPALRWLDALALELGAHENSLDDSGVITV